MSTRKSRLAGAISRFVETHEGEVPVPPPTEDAPTLTSETDTLSPEQEAQAPTTTRTARPPKSEELVRMEALEQAILQLRASHFRWASRQVGDDSANDAFQETFLRALSKAEEIRQPQEWMFACLKRVLQEMQDPAHRKELREVHGVDLDATPQEEPEQEGPSASDTLTALLEVADLSEPQRRAFLMRREGYALRVIASELGVSYGAVELLLVRATATLKQHMQASRALLQGASGE